jgi:peroxiredoxin
MSMSTKEGLFLDKVFPDVKGIPDSLLDIKLYFTWLNNIQALYQSYKAGVVSKNDFVKFYEGWGEDTINCIPSYVKTFVVIAAGTSKTGQRYYIFDSDNDYDLGDEPLYETSIVYDNYFTNNNKEFQPHKVIYEKIVNGEIEQDSTWIAFFESKEYMLIQFFEKASATFQFDSVKYKIDVRPSISKRYRGGTEFNVSHVFNKKSKNYNVGEYVKLGNSYYQLSCSSDGLKIYLNKDNNALNHGSTQIGMPPIQFVAKTLNGDTINFPSDFKGKYVLLDFWALSCGPCIQEIRDYYIGIYEKCGGSKFEIIGVADNKTQDLEKFINKNEIKWTIISDGEQKMIQKKYNITHYPTLYFINPDGVIIAKEKELRRGGFVSILNENI